MRVPLFPLGLLNPRLYHRRIFRSTGPNNDAARLKKNARRLVIGSVVATALLVMTGILFGLWYGSLPVVSQVWSAASEAASDRAASDSESTRDEGSSNVGPLAMVVGASEGVRVRAAPAADAKTLGALRTGDLVRVVDGPLDVAGQRWVKVLWVNGDLEVDNDLVGWMPFNYIAVLEE